MIPQERDIPTFAQVFVALLVAEAVFGLVFWLGWLAVLLSLLVLGELGTIVVIAVLAVEAERAAVLFVTGWTPARLRLALTGWPAAAAVFAAQQQVGWSHFGALMVAIVPALMIQTLGLRFLASADT